MKQTLFYTTMANHRPVIYSKVGVGGESEKRATVEAPRQFIVTAARDPIVSNPQDRSLGDMLARSTQPIFSVSAMFRMRSGGGCGSCGH